MDASVRPPKSRMKKLTSLSDQVYEELRHSIICSNLLPGEKLVELDIAAQMGTSQGPVREALQRLERDGLVERRARSASYVTNISVDEMYELFSVRCAVEGFAIRRAAPQITPDQCAYLESLIREMEEAVSVMTCLRWPNMICASTATLLKSLKAQGYSVSG
jgi:DNA-binding GntR family transcriptional regulator